MNINPDAKRILCFGDSNTYGTIPYELGYIERRRYSLLERWTWILQQELWNEYEIIEEWRGWRIIYNDREEDETKNGALFLEWLLHTHWPLDLVVVMLWTNDIKPIYESTPEIVAQYMEEKIIHVIDKFGCKLLIVSPPCIIDTQHTNFPLWSNEKIKKLNTLYKDLCKKYSLDYVDIQDQLICGSDGIHLTKESHNLLWLALSKKIKEII